MLLLGMCLSGPDVMTTSPTTWSTALACVVFLLLEPGASEACATVKSVGQSALLDHVYKSTSGVPLISCSAACSDDKLCYSFNFIPATDTCELSSAARSAVQPSFFVRRPGSIYFDKLQTVPIPSSCASSPCPNGVSCGEIDREPGFECARECYMNPSLSLRLYRLGHYDVPLNPSDNCRMEIESSSSFFLRDDSCREEYPTTPRMRRTFP